MINESEYAGKNEKVIGVLRNAAVLCGPMYFKWQKKGVLLTLSGKAKHNPDTKIAVCC